MRENGREREEMMLEYEIEKGAVLTKVNRYVLDKGEVDAKIFIDIHQILSDEGNGMFIAIPYLIAKEATKRFIVSGKTEDEALKGCLNCIKGVKTEQITDATKPE
jgi:hypothetical protein